MKSLNQKGNAGYKFLLFCLPSMVSLIALTTWLYPRWPKTGGSISEKISAVMNSAIREAVNKELKKATEPGPGTVPATVVAKPVEEEAPPVSDEPVNIIAKGTDKGIEFYTNRSEGNVSTCGMRVDTSPTGAEVTLNGSIVGTTPVDLRGQCDSTFKIKLYKKDFEVIDRTLTYAKEASVAIRLHRKPAALTPSPAPKGLGTSLDLMDEDY